MIKEMIRQLYKGNIVFFLLQRKIEETMNEMKYIGNPNSHWY